MNPRDREPRRLRVILLFGGRSAEHDVSCVTAVAVARALDPERYEVVPIAITTEGEWLLAGEARAALEKGAAALPAAFAVEGEPVRPPSVPAHQEIVPRSGASDTAGLAPDVVLPLLHGPYGEDGTVQGLLELAGLAYVGSGVLGSAVAMDKVMMKRAFAAAGLPQARFLELRDGADRSAFAARVVAELGLPVFVKPANMGSSVGVTKAHDGTELDAGIARALDYDEWCLAEEAVVGREIEVGVLGDDPPEASERRGAAARAGPALRIARRRGARARDPRVRSLPLRGHGEGRLLLRRLTERPRVPRQRAQHDPGLHTHLDVPDALASVRGLVPAAARPADRSRPCPSPTPRQTRRKTAVTLVALATPQSGFGGATEPPLAAPDASVPALRPTGSRPGR
jgi:D-alanine--D-alanine ligase